MPAPIRAIVRTFVSERDRNGNCYHLAQVYAVAKGEYAFVAIETGGEQNGYSLVRKIIGNGGILCTTEVLPKRQWQNKRYNLECLYEHNCDETLRKLFDTTEKTP